MSVAAFIPKAADHSKNMAGLLTYSVVFSLPIAFMRNSGKGEKQLKQELTAAGTVQDLHLIPFSFIYLVG